MRRILVALACAATTGNGLWLQASEEPSRRTLSRIDVEETPTMSSLAALLLASSPSADSRHHVMPVSNVRPANRRYNRAPASHMYEGMTLEVATEIEANPIFVDEDAMIAKKAFKIPRDQLILLAKQFLVSRGGFGADPDLLSEDFRFVAPVVGPLSKDAFVSAIGSVDVAKGFPDFNAEFHNFQVDPFEGNRVWYIARGKGTNTGPFIPFVPEAGGTGKTVVNPPQACSLTFNEKGLVTKYTIGYVIDREVGNTGGLGGLYGLLQAVGRPLPFPEAQPWQISPQYRLFQLAGEVASTLSKR